MAVALPPIRRRDLRAAGRWRISLSSPDLETGSGAEMPIMQERAVRAARAHDQADPRARDRGLCLGASGR
jgi:hypothetical protein